MSISRCVLRWGLISGLALGGATLLVGPERVAAGLAMVRGKAQDMIDICVDDPMALRRQLEQLAAEYPDRIAEVRGEVAEVDHQVGQFERDIDIAERVVALTTEDLRELKTLVAQAESRQATGVRKVALRFEGVRFSVDEAYSEARRINNVRGTYTDRLAHDKQQLAFLVEQNGRLGEILEQLESDFSTYQAQLWQLDRQIDAIERNERLIELTEQQQATLDSYNRYGKIGNLKQLEAKLAELRTIQEAQLQSLSKRGIRHDYHKKAQLGLDMDDADSIIYDEDPFAILEDVNIIESEDEVFDSNSLALSDR
jgi:chromosome segregation ATPase